MKIKEFIKILEQLDGDKTIGTIDMIEYRIDDIIEILDRQDEGSIVSSIENFRKSNKNKICDYYIY